MWHPLFRAVLWGCLLAQVLTAPSPDRKSDTEEVEPSRLNLFDLDHFAVGLPHEHPIILRLLREHRHLAETAYMNKFPQSIMPPVTRFVMPALTPTIATFLDGVAETPGLFKPSLWHAKTEGKKVAMPIAARAGMRRSMGRRQPTSSSDRGFKTTFFSSTAFATPVDEEKYDQYVLSPDTDTIFVGAPHDTYFYLHIGGYVPVDTDEALQYRKQDIVLVDCITTRDPQVVINGTDVPDAMLFLMTGEPERAGHIIQMALRHNVRVGFVRPNDTNAHAMIRQFVHSFPIQVSMGSNYLPTFFAHTATQISSQWLSGIEAGVSKDLAPPEQITIAEVFSAALVTRDLLTIPSKITGYLKVRGAPSIRDKAQEAIAFLKRYRLFLDMQQTTESYMLFRLPRLQTRRVVERFTPTTLFNCLAHFGRRRIPLHDLKAYSRSMSTRIARVRQQQIPIMLLNRLAMLKGAGRFIVQIAAISSGMSAPQGDLLRSTIVHVLDKEVSPLMKNETVWDTADVTDVTDSIQWMSVLFASETIFTQLLARLHLDVTTSVENLLEERLRAQDLPSS